MAKKKKKSGSERGSEFFKRYEGALDAGYPSDEAAAIAHTKESREGGQRRTLESFQRNLIRRHGGKKR